MVWSCLLLITIAFAVSYPLTWWCRRVAVRWGQVDRPDSGRKKHAHPIPVTGGIAIFATLFSLIVIGTACVHLLGDEQWTKLLPAFVEHLSGARGRLGMTAALLGCLAALHAIGLVDDRLTLGPGVKLLVQCVAAGVMVIGFDTRLMEWAGYGPSIVLSLLWFIVVTNAFNFLDNMDGLSAGVAILCAALLLATALLSGQWFIAAILAVLIGAAGGFLRFNFAPASIFMGDGGSLVLGFTLAFAAVRVTYFDPTVPGAHWWAVATPLIVLAIPLYDFASVTLIRLSQGRSPFVGDTQHFSHRLVRKGLSKPAAVLIIYACTLATGLGGVMMGRLAGWQAGLAVAQTLVVLGVLALLERTPNHPDYKM